MAENSAALNATTYPYPVLQPYQQYSQPYSQQYPYYRPELPVPPPWRRAPRPMPNPRSNARRPTEKVDSWMSYGTNNVQPAPIGNDGYKLNPAAPTYQPGMSQDQINGLYRPFESLRVSNGTTEHHRPNATTAVKQGTNKQNRKTSRKYTAPVETPSYRGNTRNHQLRKIGVADVPLPSIEPEEGKAAAKSLEWSSIPFRREFTPTKTRTKSPEAPEATAAYRTAAQKQPVKLNKPQKLLIILDLNGTLLYRSGANRESVHVRPGVTPFLDYIFEYHTVMIYTSATPAKVHKMVDKFLHPSHHNKLAGIWTRDMLDLTPAQYRNKVQVYKKLDKVWSDPVIQSSADDGCPWSQSNTVLIDDSHFKALAQPCNLLHVPEYLPEADPARTKDDASYKAAFKLQTDILIDLKAQLEELQFQQDVSRLIRAWQTGDAQRSNLRNLAVITDTSIDHEDDQEAGKLEFEHPRSLTHLPTPESLTEIDGDGSTLFSHHVESRKESPLERSVSPIRESVFRELREGTGQTSTPEVHQSVS